VTDMRKWPRISWRIFGCSPDSSHKVAKVCLAKVCRRSPPLDQPPKKTHCGESSQHLCSLRRQLPSIVLRGRVGSIHRRVERGWRSLRPNRHVRRGRDTSGPDFREFRTSTSFGEPST
jgi:hypothetical protein